MFVDGSSSLLPDGTVLGAADGFPVKVFLITLQNQLTRIAAPPHAVHDSSYYVRLIILPTGQILWTDETSDVEIYTPDGAPNPAWAPHIASAPTNIRNAQTFRITGTQLNGLSQGTMYGDDAQMATNYPLARIILPGGRVHYCRTFNHTWMGVASGNMSVSTDFTCKSLPLGAADLEVVANGIASNRVAVMVVR